MSERVLPWSETCFVCGESNPRGLGVRFKEVGDAVVVETVVDPEFEGYPGRLHGGVVTALLDETIGWACSAATHRLFLTAELTVRFKRPVPGGEPIVVTGRMVENTGRIALAQGRIEDSHGRLLAMARGRFVVLDEEEHRKAVPALKMPGRPARLEDV
jgi:uncharacterized protein (TIGR00369 family)